MPKDWRSTTAWQKLRATVIREEPICWLRLPGCTTTSTTADHVFTVNARPDLVMVRANLRGACAHCNYSRGAKSLDSLSTAARLPALTFFD